MGEQEIKHNESKGMKNKIGLFLEAEPQDGGTFQYSLSILEAVSALPGEKFSCVVGYTSELWLPHLKEYGLKTVFVPKGFWGRAFCLVWGVLHLPIRLLRQISPYFYPMAKCLLREHCDLWIFPAQDGRSYQFPVPALVTIHDLMHRYESRFPELSAHGKYRLREWTLRNNCKWARGILVDSDVGKEQVMKSYTLLGAHIHVLRYIAPKYIYSEQISTSFDSRYDIPKKFIFYPAQFWEHKNHGNLISAIGQLKPDIPDLKLVLAGSRKNGYRSTLKRIRDLNLVDDIIILGYVPNGDMAEFYRRARALVMPTFLGPTNIPPLEAFVIGCPVAVSNVYGMPEQAGDAALFFNPESIDEIADCIKRLWLDDKLCATLAERGKQRAAAWGQEQFDRRLKDIIEQIL